ncbi:MAG TPA: HAMP domain-containing sensor histidine kinase [Kofleriaceae bacterium]|nr:HAMP domain-containing sensor histidine kinase [Kofleriaceae bacterium]
MPLPRSLSRWSRPTMVAAIAVMGVALVAIVWTTQRNVRDARTIMLQGQAAEASGAIRTRFMDLADEPLPARVAAAFEAVSGQKVTYLAALDTDDHIVAEAGKPSEPAAAIEAWIEGARPARLMKVGDRMRVVYKRTRAPRPGNEPPPPPRTGRGPVGFVLELDPVVVDELDTAATRSLAIGVIAAVTLLALTAILVRWSLRREAAVRAVEQARHLASLGQLSAVLAHEIRNPLASLKGNAQLLARMLPEGDRPRAKADRVVDEAVRLEHLTNDLLAFARQGQIAVADADPAALVRDAAASVDGERITIDDSGAPRSWSLDADRMRQVLVNLFDNAIEMSEGQVEATVARAGNSLRIAVRDHGPGLAEADLGRIFEPFFTRRTQGTGLGLAVSKRLVELHGGTIAARNAAGGGAELVIELPREAPPSARGT